mgnify:CR=1 FL=1
MIKIKQQIRGLNSLSELNELSSYSNECKTMIGKTSLSVGSKVWVVQKTKKTEGVVTKMKDRKIVV